MSKKAYIYADLDDCGSGDYHSMGGLLVITAGYPNDAVSTGVGNEYTVERDGRKETRHGLPEPTLVLTVPDDEPDRVLVFPNAGCC